MQKDLEKFSNMEKLSDLVDLKNDYKKNYEKMIKEKEKSDEELDQFYTRHRYLTKELYENLEKFLKIRLNNIEDEDIKEVEES